MSKAAKRRRFLRWRNYRRRCTQASGQVVPLTRGMCDAWMHAAVVVRGSFWAWPPWHAHGQLRLGRWYENVGKPLKWQHSQLEDIE